MNADKNKQDGSFPEADEVYKAAAPRQSAARKRVFPRPAWLAERPEVRVRKSFSRLSTFVSHTRADFLPYKNFPNAGIINIPLHPPY
jgi:hypothetical protein